MLGQWGRILKFTFDSVAQVRDGDGGHRNHPTPRHPSSPMTRFYHSRKAFSSHINDPQYRRTSNMYHPCITTLRPQPPARPSSKSQSPTCDLPSCCSKLSDATYSLRQLPSHSLVILVLCSFLYVCTTHRFCFFSSHTRCPYVAIHDGCSQL